MGANAQTTVPTFTAGQVLTAAQMNNSARTGVPVFADTTARDAGFGGTGEKVLAEGQLCYIEASNIVQYYDGAAWATLGPASGGGLVFLTAGTYTTATSVSLPNSTFSSTYRNYKVVFTQTAQTGSVALTMRMRASGTDSSAASYYQAAPGYSSGAAVKDTANNASTSFTIGTTYASASLGQFASIVLDVIDPQQTSQTFLAGFAMFYNTDGNFETHAIGANFFATTSFDSLSLISSVASSITGIYRVYGYADS